LSWKSGGLREVRVTVIPRRLCAAEGVCELTLLSSYPPFLSVLWTMAVFFAWIIWFWLLITVFSDLFRRHDASGFTKVLWMIFVIILPYLGVFIYLIANHDGMTERAVKQQQAAQQQLDEHIRSVAPTSSTEQIAKAKQLLDSGAINQAEYESLKTKALASG
jgi:ABC-type transport system involved in cytochrome bd biosynthesis fused ATPase/permease subunit